MTWKLPLFCEWYERYDRSSTLGYFGRVTNMRAGATITEETTCRSCGNAHQLQFCPQCGEKRYDPRSLNIGHFFEETLEGLFHFDTKFLRTVKTLIRRPGQLSLDTVEGRRVGAVRPFQLFVIVNIVIFFLLFSNPFSLPLKNYITYRPFTNFNTVERVNEHLAAAKLTLPEFAKDFDHRMHSASKSLIVVLIPMYALVFGLLFLTQRKRIVEHLVFATHYITFALLTFLVVLYLFAGIELVSEFMGFSFNDVFDPAMTMLITAIFIFWIFFAIRRFYKPHLVHAIIVAVLVGGGFFYILQGYRMLLFYLLV